MFRASTLLMAAALLPLACATQAQAAPAVVAVEYRLPGQAPETIENTLVTPLERRLLQLPKVLTLMSMANHGSARLDVLFDGGATEEDLAATRAEVERFDQDNALGAAGLVGIKPLHPMFADQAPPVGAGASDQAAAPSAASD